MKNQIIKYAAGVLGREPIEFCYSDNFGIMGKKPSQNIGDENV